MPATPEAAYLDFEFAFLALIAAPWPLVDIDLDLEPRTASHFDECPRCGGHGRETYFAGDVEHSVGPCDCCGGLGEIEVESFDCDDSGAKAHVISAEG